MPASTTQMPFSPMTRCVLATPVSSVRILQRVVSRGGVNHRATRQVGRLTRTSTHHRMQRRRARRGYYPEKEDPRRSKTRLPGRPTRARRPSGSRGRIDRRADRAPKNRMPITPPATLNVTASIRKLEHDVASPGANRLANTDLARAFGHETSIMFMIPMPPTRSEMAAMDPRKSVRISEIWLRTPRMSFWLMTVKSSC